MARKINNINYDRRLDKEVKLYIKKLQSVAGQPPNADINRIRLSYNAVCDAFKSELPDQVKINTHSIIRAERKISFREYKKDSNAKAQILYAHGGGFIMGGLETHNGICADICDQTGLMVTAVDYRLSPEYRHPAAFEDLLEIYKNLDQTIPVIVAGDSAGGTLVAMLANHLKHSTNPLKGQVLIYPYLGGDMTTGSYLKHSNAPCLTSADMKFYLKCWMKTGYNSVKLPLNETDFSRLPPTVIFTASDDPLNSDGINYKERINLAKGKVIHFEGEGLVHGFLRARYTSKKAKLLFKKIIETIIAISETKSKW